MKKSIFKLTKSFNKIKFIKIIKKELYHIVKKKHKEIYLKVFQFFKTKKIKKLKKLNKKTKFRYNSCFKSFKIF